MISNSHNAAHGAIQSAEQVVDQSAGHVAPSAGLSLYRLIWRWHFYAGLFCIPFVLVLAISGAIYLFKPQIDSWVESPFMHVATNGERSSANQQINAALRQLPHSQFLSYRLPQADDEAVQISLLQQGKTWLLYIDPYTLKPLAKKRQDQLFIEQVKDLHGELLSGPVGSIVVELAACWALVLVISGLYLWWPRGGAGWGGRLYPRLGQGKARLWRDLHGVTGFYIALFTLFLLLTALPWTQVWGKAFKQVRQFIEVQVQQDWSTGRKAEKMVWRSTASDWHDLPEPTYQLAHAQHLAAPVLLSVADAKQGLWKLSSQNQNRMLRADIWLDSQQHKVMRKQGFADKKLVDKVMGIGISVHEGQLFGWFNQLLGVFTALGLVILSITGLVLWQRRKPSCKLGTPSFNQQSNRHPKWRLMLILPALFLPVLMGSIVFIWLLEWSLLRRFTASRRWLGLDNPS